jgi:hypothetical protein
MSLDPESPYKARLCAQMMAATAVLAALAPDDFRRRILARPGFVYCYEFVRWARRAKNGLKGQRETRELVRQLERELAELEHKNFAPYEVIRHSVAAHRQTFDADDAVTNIASGNDAWTDISDAAVRILAEDARAIWNLLADPYDVARLENFPLVPKELRCAIDKGGFEPPPSGLVPGVGSFDATRPDATQVIQGGELGDRLRQVVDAVRQIKVLSQLWQVVNGHEPFWRVVASAMVSDAATLVDLLYEQPHGTRPEHLQLPVLGLLERDDPSVPAIPILRAGLLALDRSALAHVRTLRRTIGAHVDDRRTVAQLMRDLEGFNPNALNSVIDNVFEALSAARRADLRLASLRLIDSSIAGMWRLDEPEDIRGYG